MDVHDAVREASFLLPGEPVDEGEDPRWQAIIQVGEYIESAPEAVWNFICTWGGHPQEDLRMAIATCLLEHLLEYHFLIYFPRVEEQVLNDPLFGDMFSSCAQFGQAGEQGNTDRFKTLKEHIQKRRPARR